MGALRGLFLGLACALLLLVGAAPAQAASAKLQLSPTSVNVTVGQTFSIVVQVNTDTSINAASGTIAFPGSVLQAVSTSKSGSIFSFWTSEPTISGENVTFGGGLSNPGYTGTNGKLLTVTFRAKTAGTANVIVSDGKTLANDGKGTNIYSGYVGSTVTVGVSVTGAKISSSTHPDQNVWYTSKNATLSWDRPAGVQGFSYKLRKESEVSAFKQESTNLSTVNFENLGDGTWIFELTANFSGSTRVSSYIFRIDSTPPENFTITTATKLGRFDPTPTLVYKAEDQFSGIDRYELFLDDGQTVSTPNFQYQLSGLTSGKHLVRVRAYDKAGNYKDSQIEVEIGSMPVPQITDYPTLVSVLQPITLKGKAIYGTYVRLYINGKKVADFPVSEFLSGSQRSLLAGQTPKPDDEVEWAYSYRGVLLPGKQIAYVTQHYPGIAESPKSNEVVVTILATSITLFGIAIPIFFAVFLLLFLLLLLGALTFWLVGRSRKKSRELEGRLLLVKEEVDESLTRAAQELESSQGTPEQLDGIRQIGGEISALKASVDEEIDTVMGNKGKKPKKATRKREDKEKPKPKAQEEVTTESPEQLITERDAKIIEEKELPPDQQGSENGK